MKISDIIEALKDAIGRAVDSVTSGGAQPQPIPVRVKDKRRR